jgi:hypothetical protein
MAPFVMVGGWPCASAAASIKQWDNFNASRTKGRAQAQATAATDSQTHATRAMSVRAMPAIAWIIQ